ncbi:MAG: NAD-dependent epimerase/dehydratase family protein, partial [Brachymonas sp.]
MKVLVTGATGFVGRALCDALVQSKHQVVAISRSPWEMQPTSSSLSNSEQSTQVLCRVTADFGNTLGIQAPLEACHAVVHCAARVHQVRETSTDPLADYRLVNTHATLNLAKVAAQAGVRRFVFLSSVKVNGDFSPAGQPFKAEQAAPADPYGLSKWEAEMGLREIAAKTGMELVIIRPPLVYGPGVQANFL